MSKRTVDGEWKEYFAKVVPANAPLVQITETRRAFYGGAWCMLNLLLSVGGDEVSEESGAAYLEELRQEILVFYEKVGHGGM